MYDDPSVTESFVLGKHCSFTFTHELVKGMDMAMAKKMADNILDVLQKGVDPPVTKAHADRVCTMGLPPLMPEAMLKKNIKMFDVEACNASVRSILSNLNPKPIRIEKISTCMGCLVTTCVVDVEHVPAITNALVGWAKPIIETNAMKKSICTAWRMSLEGMDNSGSNPLAAAAAAADLKDALQKNKKSLPQPKPPPVHAGKQAGLVDQMAACNLGAEIRVADLFS